MSNWCYVGVTPTKALADVISAEIDSLEEEVIRLGLMKDAATVKILALAELAGQIEDNAKE